MEVPRAASRALPRTHMWAFLQLGVLRPSLPGAHEIRRVHQGARMIRVARSPSRINADALIDLFRCIRQAFASAGVATFTSSSAGVRLVDQGSGILDMSASQLAPVSEARYRGHEYSPGTAGLRFAPTPGCRACHSATLLFQKALPSPSSTMKVKHPGNSSRT